MKKIAFITAWMVIGWLLVASISSTFAYMGQRGGLWFAGYNMMYSTDVQREVKNISTWVEITMTTGNSTILEHMKWMLTQGNVGTPLNNWVKIDRVAVQNGMRLTITSTDADIVKSIQQRAAISQSWSIENSWQGHGGMMGRWYGVQGYGQWTNGFWRGRCPMFGGY